MLCVIFALPSCENGESPDLPDKVPASDNSRSKGAPPKGGNNGAPKPIMGNFGSSCYENNTIQQMISQICYFTKGHCAHLLIQGAICALPAQLHKLLHFCAIQKFMLIHTQKYFIFGVMVFSYMR